jgi:enoyl-CoA hydratase
MGDLIRVDVKDGVALLTLDNPPLNVVSLELRRQLDEALVRLESDPAVRVLVVTGAGKRAFCVGSDIKEFPDYIRDGNVIDKKMRGENQTYSRLDDFAKPTIAALNGAAMGGGLELAVCCDILIAEESTKLALPEVKLAVFPGSGGTVRVPRRIGEGRAKEMMFLGDPIDSRTALAWGLVNRVVPDGQAVDAALAMAREMATRPNRALQICKKAIDISLDLPEDESIERVYALTEEAFATNDAKEGFRAFFAKDKPKFTHS